MGYLNVWGAVLYYAKVVAKDPCLLNLDDVILLNLKEEFYHVSFNQKSWRAN